jgi:hypothetical protein
LGIDDAVGILYNTFFVVINGYQERMWVGASHMVWVLLKEFLYPGESSGRVVVPPLRDA